MGQPVACTVRMLLTPTLLCLILNPGATLLSATWQPFDKQLISTSVACTVRTLLTPTLLSCLILNPGATSLTATWQPFNKQQTTDFHLPCCLHSTHMAHSHPPPLASRCHVAIGNQTLNNRCHRSSLSMGQGQDEDTARTHNIALLLLIDIQVVPVV